MKNENNKLDLMDALEVCAYFLKRAWFDNGMIVQLSQDEVGDEI